MIVVDLFKQGEGWLMAQLRERQINVEPVKFVITGSISSLSALVTIFILVEGFNFWPVLGSVLSNVVSGVVGFTLHKHWTFQNKSPAWRKQAFFFLGLVAGNLVVSAGLMYLLNDILGIWYFLDQILIIFSLATVNFFINKLIIFKHH